MAQLSTTDKQNSKRSWDDNDYDDDWAYRERYRRSSTTAGTVTTEHYRDEFEPRNDSDNPRDETSWDDGGDISVFDS